jgi:type IV pilus assembly protein PilX
MPSHFVSSHRQQQGVVLFLALILLVILTLMGVVLARLQTSEERMASNDQNHSMALQGAEAALRYVDDYSAQYGFGPFNNSAGLYQFDPINQPNAYLTSVNGNPWTVANGAIAYPFAGSTVGVSQAPQFIIENMPQIAPPCESTAITGYGASTPPPQVLRVTARSVGGDGTSSAEVQMVISGKCS